MAPSSESPGGGTLRSHLRELKEPREAKVRVTQRHGSASLLPKPLPIMPTHSASPVSLASASLGSAEVTIVAVAALLPHQLLDVYKHSPRRC